MRVEADGLPDGVGIPRPALFVDELVGVSCSAPLVHWLACIVFQERAMDGRAPAVPHLLDCGCVLLDWGTF